MDRLELIGRHDAAPLVKGAVHLLPANLVGEVIWGKRNAGLSTFEGTQIYTSRGCGFVGPPMRVGAPPEVVKIILVA